MVLKEFRVLNTRAVRRVARLRIAMFKWVAENSQRRGKYFTRPRWDGCDGHGGRKILRILVAELPNVEYIRSGGFGTMGLRTTRIV